MSNITIKFKDGTKREFKHQGRAGGSYTKELRYEGAFVVIRDEWYTETTFPAGDISEIITQPERS